MPYLKNRELTAIASIMLLAMTPSACAQTAPQAEQGAEDFLPLSQADNALLSDAIDIHTHLDPDSFGAYSSQTTRRLDVIDMARRAKAANMRGFVIKQHYDQTAQLAYLANKEVPSVTAFGMLCMNLTVGGMNPVAIYHFAEVKGGLARIVSMPTWDSANNIRQSTDPTRPAVGVSRNGKLLPEAIAVIKAIADAPVRDTDVKLALATGHITAEEVLMVIREAKNQGIKNIIVTHANAHPIDMTMEQMQEAVGLGAFIEMAVGFTESTRSTLTAQEYYDAIRAIGPEHVILSSDGGQTGRAPPDVLLGLVAGKLRDLGMTQAELRMMLVENPATLLSIPQ